MTQTVMSSILDSPIAVFMISLIAQGIAAYVGDFLRGRRRPVRKDEGEDLAIVEAAVLTLLALIIGFSFSMAVTRYDQRKNYEEAEANAIGTEYVRADFLPAENAAGVRELLRNYLDRRIAFYLKRDDYQTGQADAEIAKLQTALWAGILPAANAQPSPVIALAVSGMNDVFNSHSRTQAAWWNRIPVTAWALMGLIATSCNLLLGYGERRRGALLLLVLPLIVSISFWLIADIDSPHGGIIRVLPHSLISLSESLKITAGRR
jgi:protein-S-isoprenylcysteine O-methyltransferase Ste14